MGGSRQFIRTFRNDNYKVKGGGYRCLISQKNIYVNVYRYMNIYPHYHHFLPYFMFCLDLPRTLLSTMSPWLQLEDYAKTISGLKRDYARTKHQCLVPRSRGYVLGGISKDYTGLCAGDIRSKKRFCGDDMRAISGFGDYIGSMSGLNISPWLRPGRNI